MRVLVVDDDDLFRYTVVSVLEQDGHAALGVSDGEAIPAAIGGALAPFDAAIVDLDMPRVDGEAAIGRLRAEGHALPVIVLSGRARPVRGASLVLPKPFFQPSKLLELLRQLVADARAA